MAHARRKARKRRLAAIREADRLDNLTVKYAKKYKAPRNFRFMKTQGELLADVRHALTNSQIKEN